MSRPRTIGPVILAREVTINPGSITGATTLDVTTAVAGLRTEMPIACWAPNLEDNVTLSNAHCASAGVLKFRLANITASPINPASQIFCVVQF